MQRFEDLLSHHLMSEAISLKNAKKKRLSKKYSGAYNERLDEVFGGKNRIFLNLKIDYTNMDSPIMKRINSLLYNHDYSIDSMLGYIKGIAYKVKHDTMELDKKNPVKIGKLLQKFEEDGEIEVTDRVNGKKTTKKVTGKPLLHEFKNDPIRATNGEFLIVISRHPYDIAGASTDRSWTSCMDLGLPRINYPKTRPNEGVNRKYIPRDIEEGTLVAYVVTKDEMYIGANGEPKVKLEKPLSRMLMKPHNSDVGSVYAVGKMYGSPYPEFYQKVKEWTSKNLNNKLTGGEKIYKNRHLYDDNDTPVDFKFNSGNTIADEVLTDKLNYHNEKELGNEITFTTEGNNIVTVEIDMKFEFEEDIVKPFSELTDFKKHDIKDIYSPIEKALASVVYDSLNIGKYDNTYPVIDMVSQGDGMDVTIKFDVNVYSEDDKYIDDDTIGDIINDSLRNFEYFNYKELKSILYKICKQYDWNAEEQRHSAEIEKYVSRYSQAVDTLSGLIPDIGIVSKLNIVSPEKMASYGNEEMVRYTKEMSKIRQALGRIVSIKTNNFDRTIPYMISREESYQKRIHQIFQQWFLNNFKIDLRKYSDQMGDMWRFKKVHDMSNKIPEEDYENLLDVHHELFQIDASIERLIGHNPNDIKI
jgi:hypothetical protein